MTYTRVIPRDFFNEAKLLKCMGQLSLKILDRATPDGVKIEIEETGEAFKIDLTEDGHLLVTNCRTTVNGTPVTFKTAYNSKSAFPLLVDYDYEETEVFDDAGNFTPEFIEFAKNLKSKSVC